jgi:LmbE family N-acetylglucosaminyl deacetylase
MPQKSLMAIGAHADDIELQAGGTVAKYHAAGYGIVYVMTTNNMSGRVASMDAQGKITSRWASYREMEPLRKKEAAAAARYFGTEPIHLDYPQRHYTRDDGSQAYVGYGTDRPDNISDGVHTILTACDNDACIQRVADLILEHDAEAVLTHGGPMGNVEHFATLVLVTHAYWRAVKAGYRGMLLNWHDLGVNIYAEAYKHFDSYIDITEHFQQKIESSAFHACQKPDPARLDWPQWGPAFGCGHAEVYTIIGRNRWPDQYGAFTLEILRNER